MLQGDEAWKFVTAGGSLVDAASLRPLRNKGHEKNRIEMTSGLACATGASERGKLGNIDACSMKSLQSLDPSVGLGREAREEHWKRMETVRHGICRLVCNMLPAASSPCSDQCYRGAGVEYSRRTQAN